MGQSHAKRGDGAKHDLKWVFKDPSMTLYRPKTVVLEDAENLESLKRQAKKQLADWRLEGFTLTVTVGGHATRDGVLWSPGQRVHVIDEEHGIDAVFFLMGRRFSPGRKGRLRSCGLRRTGCGFRMRIRKNRQWRASGRDAKKG